MTVATLRRVALAMLACTAAGCAGRTQSPSPVRARPREGVLKDLKDLYLSDTRVTQE